MGLSFEDSLRGVETQIPVEAETACSECRGSGAQPGSSPQVCPECKGRGVTVESQGMFGLSHACPRCHGSGTVIEKPCPRCHGSGRERRTSHVYRIYRLTDSCALKGEPLELEPITQRLKDAALADGWLLLSFEGQTVAVPAPAKE